ncbi:MAG: 4-hydroxythreonine-4-phosphate dehydrogenase PdxA [Bacteroidales bacterium]|nr:4-hydroxythreonine-4-phosphate dehydrogenase PdxA [Bacteroidales bacterium]
MNKEEKKPGQRVKVGITHGDLNGIGYEVIIKTLHDQRMLESITPLVYGTSKVASYHRKVLDMNDFNFNLVKNAAAANPRRPNMINCSENEVKIDLGKSTSVAGELAYLALEKACDDLMAGEIDVLVTAPINKKNIQSDDFHFPGHTEYLAEKFGANEFLMLMVSNNLRIGVITGHIPLGQVPEAITQELILSKTEIMHETLKRDFNIARPRIALLGLNPHAGDGGLLGKEETDTIIPAISTAFDKGILAYGPYAADGLFGSSSFRSFDGILAMYHDQGLIPFKAMAFESGVNYSAGLPFIRTSPAHGTAYELAGKNEASPESMRAAIFLAADIFINRSQFDAMNVNPLEITNNNGENGEE